jgi:hypothetical protein
MKSKWKRNNNNNEHRFETTVSIKYLGCNITFDYYQNINIKPQRFCKIWGKIFRS